MRNVSECRFTCVVHGLEPWWVNVEWIVPVIVRLLTCKVCQALKDCWFVWLGADSCPRWKIPNERAGLPENSETACAGQDAHVLMTVLPPWASHLPRKNWKRWFWEQHVEGYSSHLTKYLKWALGDSRAYEISQEKFTFYVVQIIFWAQLTFRIWFKLSKKKKKNSCSILSVVFYPNGIKVINTTTCFYRGYFVNV